MATVYNPLDTIITLLDDNYVNQDSIAPLISKIYEQPTNKEPRPGEDFIYLYSLPSTLESSSLGNTSVVDIRDTLRIDIRSRPSNTTQGAKTNDTHARKVLTEVKRVLFSSITSPGAGFTYIDPNGVEIQDLSNGARGMFRYIIKIDVVSYCRDITA